MANQHMLLLAALAVAALALPRVQAAKFSVKTAVAYNGAVQLGPPGRAVSENCTAPFFCKPQLVPLAGNQVWAWCGFQASHKLQMYITTNTSKQNFTSQLMRKKAWEGCALKNLTNLASCEQLDFSICDTLAVCDLRVLGMAYNDETCLIIANNKNTTMAVNVVVNSWYSRSRTYGTAFAVLIGILFFLAMFTYLGVRCVQEWKHSTYHGSYTGGHYNSAPSSIAKPLLDGDFKGSFKDEKPEGKKWHPQQLLQMLPWRHQNKDAGSVAHIA